MGVLLHHHQQAVPPSAYFRVASRTRGQEGRVSNRHRALSWDTLLPLRLEGRKGSGWGLGAAPLQIPSRPPCPPSSCHLHVQVFILQVATWKSREVERPEGPRRDTRPRVLTSCPLCACCPFVQGQGTEAARLAAQPTQSTKLSCPAVGCLLPLAARLPGAGGSGESADDFRRTLLWWEHLPICVCPMGLVRGDSGWSRSWDS